MYIWAAIATICFIGVVTSQPARGIIDRNILNHLIVVMAYYVVGYISFEVNFAYFILVFVFTYLFFILKDSGYDKSLTTWTYVQCLVFATTLTQMPITMKIMSTFIAYIEAQLVLWLSFKLFPSPNIYIMEEWIYKLKHVCVKEWINLSYEKVQLAIRGSLTAGVLYLMCVLLITNDIKPNWAVIAAISCLLKNDDVGSKRTIISMVIGTFVGFLCSWLIIKYYANNNEVNMFMLWLSLIVGVICIFEYRLTLSIKTQIIGVVAVTITLSCLYVLLGLNSQFYLHLRLINNIIGIIAASLAYLLWGLFKHYQQRS